MAATRNAAALSMAIVLLTVQLLWAGGSMAQSSDCTPLLLGLQPCLPYITGNTSTPAKTCCTQLANVVKVSPTCLCQLLDGSFGVSGINRTRALDCFPKCVPWRDSITSHSEFSCRRISRCAWNWELGWELNQGVNFSAALLLLLHRGRLVLFFWIHETLMFFQMIRRLSAITTLSIY
ncbi:unnamed protein product [Linum tenue]|uniref:Bifunctional inhibitor/plant lipid transfer protein/seed storage helical domain-containing protein n=1 Tax=Linum tenue TaxID=586396 RepID=A0AAV0P6E1_9ROSI|nr:unnamed protein product [Linum tenue]